MPILALPQLNDFLQAIQAGLDPHPPGKKYLIGVSGGRDSQSLLHALHALGCHRLIVCHLNHRLRGTASRADANLVSRTAAKLGLPLESADADTKSHAARRKISLELAARELRLDFFARCARKHRCRRLFLAHHADDQVETCLFNFLRGTGTAGLAGMKSVMRIGSLEIHRPLLAISRDQITTYARETKISWREDASNNSLDHTRNRLRQAVLPAIEAAMGPSFKAAILRAADILREEEAWMDSLVPPIAERLCCKTLKAMPAALRRRTVLRWLRERGVPVAGYQETLRTLALLDPHTGPAKASLPGGFHVRRRAGEIFLEP